MDLRNQEQFVSKLEKFQSASVVTVETRGAYCIYYVVIQHISFPMFFSTIVHCIDNFSNDIFFQGGNVIAELREKNVLHLSYLDGCWWCESFFKTKGGRGTRYNMIAIPD